MLRILLLAVLTSACSMNATKKGGDDQYVYSHKENYTPEALLDLTPKVIATRKRNPQVGKFKELFSKNQPPLKRIGIVVFESMIQNSFTGLAAEDRVYLSDQGKQLLSEKLLSIWEQSFPIIDSEVDYVSTAQIKKAKSLKQYGAEVKNYVVVPRAGLAPDDVFFLEKGKKTSMVISHNPRGMRDMSFLLVPATELMAGPKWSEHNKHFVNDLAKELNLDAVIIVQSTIKWTVARTDKNSGESFPEELVVDIKASTLVPLSRYNERLAKTNNPSTPNHTLCYRSYEGVLKFPITLSIPIENESFEVAMSEIINPALKVYRDLAVMTMNKISADLKKTR